MKHARGIEVGQVFKLGTKYSEAMKAYYKDENMKDHPDRYGVLRHRCHQDHGSHDGAAS